jgi:hypothetical protein
MLLFAHTGITLGAATVISGAANYRQGKTAWLTSLSKYMDIRFLIIGSMLPDIIDKPIGQYFFADTFSNGRIFSHTLSFLVLLTVIGFLWYKTKHQIWGLSLAAGTLAHLVLDGMWGVPETFFWPFFGWEFENREISGWLGGLFDTLVSNPAIYISEVIGFVISVWFGLLIIKRKQLKSLIKTGKAS